jgi:D-lactate dehydrogenase
MFKTMKISFFSFRGFEKPFYNLPDLNVHYFNETLSQENMVLAEGSDIICCFVNDKLNAEVLQNLADKGLKMIALRCAGFNNVDLNYAKKLNIKVVRVPAYSPNSVAEHAVALLLSLNRKTHKAYNRVREGNFSLDGLTGFDIFNKTIGVLGTGKIGAVFCKIMLGFGAKVFAYDPFPDEALISLGVKYIGKDELFTNSDIISLHLPLLPESKHIINESSVEKMKNGVFLINTSRGGLVKTSSVIKGLKSGKIGALGLDVYEEEEGIFFIDHSLDLIDDDELSRLMTFPNVLITSHQAFLTENALTNIADTTIKSIRDFQSGIAPDFLIF